MMKGPGESSIGEIEDFPGPFSFLQHFENPAEIRYNQQ
jgi:hypothetical protein